MDFSFTKFQDNKNVTDKGALPLHGEVLFKFEAKRSEGIRKLDLIINDDEYYPDFKSRIFPFTWMDTVDNVDIFEAKVDLSDFQKGIYFLNVRVYSKDEFFIYDKFDYRRQLTLFENKDEGKLKNGIIYHIFVDRFKKSGKSKVKPSSILNPDWENGTPEFAPHPGDFLKNNVVFGGDLFGIGEKIDYIASLGVKYIYLSPIFDAYSNHKYDTGNYMAVDEGFGGEEGLKYLSSKAKEKGIELILDGVFNHTGDHSLYFNKYSDCEGEGAYNSKNSPYYEWYNFEEFPEKYESWWGIETLPRVKSSGDSYIDYICGKNSVVTKWMPYDVGAWRLDVADELSDKFLKAFKKRIKEENKDAFLIGEVWENASNKISYSERRQYFLGEELDSVMNYPVREGIISLFKDENTEKFLNTLKVINYQYPDFVKNRLMNLLGTHDTERIITTLAGKALDNNDNALLADSFLDKEERLLGEELIKAAYGILYFLPGMPSLFYGDEIGMEGYHDPFCRRPFKWQNVEGSTLLPFFKKLGEVRNKNSAFEKGPLNIIFESEKAFILERCDEKERIILGFNLSQEALEIKSSHGFKNLLTSRKANRVKLKKFDFCLLSSSKENEITAV